MLSSATSKSLILALFIVVLIACENNDLDLQENNLQTIAITVIGQDLDTIYQYDYDSSSDTGSQLNLTSELGVGVNYLTLRQFNNTVSFFTFSNNAISLSQKNLTTGAITSYPSFYDISSERSLVWGTNDDVAVYFGLYKPLGSTNLTLRVVDLNTLEGTDIALEFGIQDLYEPLYAEGKLYMTYRDGIGNYKISVYDTDSNGFSQTLQFGEQRPSIVITDLGDLAIFTRDETNETFLELFNTTTLQRISRKNLVLDQLFEPGPIKGAIIDNKLFYQYIYAQPFTIENGPAILNLDSGENTIIDLVGIRNELNLGSEFNIQPILGQYLSAKNIFAISYFIQNGSDQELGGMLFISPEGKLIANKSLNFIPTYFVE